MRFLILFILLTSNVLANEAPNIKNLVINNELKTYDNITFLDSNEKIIKSTLEKSGYKLRHDEKKMFFSLGPFVDVSHAKNEVKKLKKIHSIDSKVVDFVF